MPTRGFFTRPTTTVLYGADRPLLNWVAYALASASDPGFIWTDVRLEGEVLAQSDILAGNLIPPERLNVIDPETLAPHRSAAKAAVENVVRDGESDESLQRLMDFLRLPLGAQRLLAKGSSGSHPLVLVLSNAQRAVALWPSETVAPVLGAIVGAGGTFIMTFADAPPGSHRSFDVMLEAEGEDLREWDRVRLRVLKGPANGPLRTGELHRLGELAPLAAILARDLGGALGGPRPAAASW